MIRIQILLFSCCLILAMACDIEEKDEHYINLNINIYKRGENCHKDSCLKSNPCTDNATIILYQHNVNTGPSQEFDIKRCCFKVPDDYANTISQIDTRGNCLKAFSSSDCSGNGKFIVPGHCDFPVADCGLNDLVRSLMLC